MFACFHIRAYFCIFFNIVKHILGISMISLISLSLPQDVIYSAHYLIYLNNKHILISQRVH